MESLSNVLHVVGVESGNGDTSVHGQVDVVLLDASLDLSLGQSGVGEHTNLAGDVRPVAGASSLLQVLDQSLTHGDDAVSHSGTLLIPLSLQLGVSQHGLDNASSVQRRVRPEGTSSHLQLREHALLLLLGGAHHGGSSATLSVETEVLGEGLSQADLVSVSHELADGEGVALHISRGESLVGAIEDHTAVVSLDGLADLLPLLLGGVHTGGVVGAGVEQEGGLGGGLLDLSEDSVNVQAVVGVQVRVLEVGNSSSVEHAEVVGPGGVGDVHTLVALHVLQEVSQKTQRTGSRKSLAHGDSVLLYHGGLNSVDKLGSQSVEVGQTLNGRILVIALSGNTSLSLGNARENHGLAVVVTVSTHTQRNLAGILISLELLVQSKNGIWGSLSNLRRYPQRYTSYSSPAAGGEGADESRLKSASGL